MERPAPSRLTPWPGNEKLTLPEDIDPEDGRKGYHMMKGCVLHYENGEEFEFQSLKAAADHLGLNKTSFRNCINTGKIPLKDGLEGITYQDTFLHDVAMGNRKACYIVTDKRHTFISSSELARTFGKCESVVRKWIKQGHSRTNGIMEIGYL
jgi:hypothetical protein